MADVNYAEYGEDLLRVTDTAGDVAQFGATNGYELGVLIAIFIVLLIILLILALGVRYGKRLIQMLT